MNLVKLTPQDAVLQYPYNPSNLRVDHPSVGFPDDLTGVDLAEYSVAIVEDTAPPAHNAVTHDLSEVAPIKTGQGWVQQWVTVQVSPAVQQARSAAIGRSIDADVDAIYAAVQGNRGAEYALAEAEATAFKAAGYTGTAPGSVASWATVKGQSNTWATDDILATAALWRGAQAAMRAKRLKCKEDAKAPATVQAAMDEWAAFVLSLKSQLGVS